MLEEMKKRKVKEGDKQSVDGKSSAQVQLWLKVKSLTLENIFLQ